MEKNPEMSQLIELNFKDRWIKVWRTNSFRFQFVASILLLIAIAISIDDFFNYIELRQGYEISDILLNNITPRNLSVPIFILIYAVVLISIFHLSGYPVILLKCIQAYTLLTIMRILTLTFIPLEPSSIMIPLEDPFIGYFFYGNKIITKDLFFSGHISTMLLLVFYNPLRTLQYFFAAITILTSIFILVQHVHYTADILAAPFFAYLSYKSANAIPLKINT